MNEIDLFNKDKIMEEANECLNCPAKPCENIGCPMKTRIPDFIGLIKEDKIEEAYYLLKENNMFSFICSKICPQEEQCEGNCIRNKIGTPTKIGLLEEYVNVKAKELGLKEPAVKIEDNKDKKVAIIGSGPAGLECALELRKKGIIVDVFEKDSNVGGLLEYEIPDFRLDKSLIRKIIDDLKDLGINFHTNKTLGKDFHIESLKEEYDAIFIGIGAEKSNNYDLGSMNKVYNSSEFLRAYYSKEYIDNLGDTIIIGGGNVAMDCSRAALKMGATSSTICYRRDEAHMPAREKELKEALENGVKKEFLTRVISKENDKVTCIRTQIIDGKAKDVEGKLFEIKADSVIFAIGLKPNNKLLEEENLKLTENGMLFVDENNMTSIQGVFAGGDVIETKATVCRALASGKIAAENIIKYLEGE